ncbi:MAG: polysaccharide lyase family protein [Bacteroidetes bacterium]|nr:polysaccharide lyase family protein [Bacteroidota bacterium]
MTNSARNISLVLLQLIFLSAFGNVPGGGSGTGPNVTLTDSATVIILDNGIVSIRINKTNASISQFNYKSLNLFQGGYQGGQFYWDWNMPKDYSGPKGATCTIVTNPKNNAGAYAEVKIHSPWSGKATDAAMDVDIYYSLSRGNQGYYAAAVLTHPANYPTNPGGQWRCNAYVSSMFNWLSIDSTRNQIMPTLDDVKNASPVITNPATPAEVTLMTTGIYKGKYYCKYSLSADLGDSDVYGWTSESKHVGIWMTLPSHEYYNGGPMKRELIGHEKNTLLNMFNGTHYAQGSDTKMDTGVFVQKTYGPFLIYANSYSGSAVDPVAKVAAALWKDAKAQAAAEQSAWPYKWFKHAEYKNAAQRGTVTGTLKVNDANNSSASAANVWIGLAPDDNGTHFQYQAHTYQFWVKTDKNGNFTIPKVIAGTYHLNAFGGANIGEFKKTNLQVTAGKTLALGTVTWMVDRVAPTLWDIGVPNKDSKEFKNGDYNYSQWQNYLNMPLDYPNGVKYSIGSSNYKKDWPNGLRDATSYTVNFNLDHAPTTIPAPSLYVALASNFHTRFTVTVNGTQVANITPVNSSNAVIRLGSHGAFWDTRITIPAKLLKKGANTIVFNQLGGTIQFDYIRLEASIPEYTLIANGPTTFCESASVTLTASSGKSYKWFKDATLLATTTASYNVTESGLYSVEITDDNGVKDTTNAIKITVIPHCISLTAASTSTAINLSWTTSNIAIKTLEIMRNTTASPTGRIRVASLSSQLLNYSDISANANTDYWYWIKITDQNNVIYNSESAQGRIDVVTAVNEFFTIEKGFVIYPNPANNEISISLLNDESIEVLNAVEITDMHGAVVLSFSNSQISKSSNSFDISSLSSGMYIIKFSDKENTVTQKFVKQ